MIDRTPRLTAATLTLEQARRRRLLGSGVAAAALPFIVRPAAAAPAATEAAIAAFIRAHDAKAGAALQKGRVTFGIAPLVENGNVVPVTVAVDSPMTAADHVRAVALFTERNPQSEVIAATLGSRAGRARVETRIRLADSQRVTALAVMSDGAVWFDAVDVVVTLAACIES